MPVALTPLNMRTRRALFITMKEPMKFDEQLNHLVIDKKLKVNNTDNALQILKQHNYYRLSGYWKFFLDADDFFDERTSFEKIYEIYKFDRFLRSQLIEVITDIEVYFKTQLAYYLGNKYGAIGYLNSENFDEKKIDSHKKFIDTVENINLTKKDNPIVKHHATKYDGNIPVWALVELVSFGSVSKLYSLLNTHDQKEFCKMAYKNINHLQLDSFIHAVTALRNTCCHFQRLYKYKPSIRAKKYTFDLNDVDSYNVVNFDYVGYSMFIALLLLPSKSTGFKFIKHVTKYMKINVIDPRDYGMYKGWAKLFRVCIGYCVNL